MSESLPRPTWRRRLEPVVGRLSHAAARRVRRVRTARAAAELARTSGADRQTPAHGGARVGVVERFGPFHIVGWIADEADNLPARVTLHVNDLQVAATWAGQPSKYNTLTDMGAFHFALKDLWKYCSARDKLTVRLDGVPLPIVGRGTFRRPPGNGERTLAELQDKFKHGYVFSQRGRLQLSKKLDTDWQAVVLGLYDRVSAVVTRDFGYDPFLIYGSLLGQVREGGFIGHDVDFDAAYLSRKTDPQLVVTELRDIALRLVDEGFNVECMRSALHISDVADPGARIDLFHLYVDDEDALQFPFGTVTPTPFPASRWSGVTDAEFSGHVVKVPASAEAVVEHLYGPSWRVPTPGFAWPREKKSSQPAAFTRPEHREEVYWANFYARHELADGSTFFDFVTARDDIPGTVLDIGCGDGRDAFAFARHGSRVHGIDRSHVGVRHASQTASDVGLSDRLSFSAVDVSNAPAVRESVSSLRSDAGGGPILFYLRFFLHSIPEDVQDTLLDALADTSREGDMVAIEFRTEADAENKKVHGGHYRRYQSGTDFGRSLRDRYGFADVRFEQESAGLAPYKDEDPVVYRVVAGHTGRAAGG